MTSEANKCLIVLGMHRSGTSALAGCLNLMGVNFGTAMMPGNQANQAGYFENQDIVLTHDILLRDLGCRWDMVGNLPEGWEESDAAEKSKQILSGILERQFLNKDQLFAVKDPRLCRLMPLWSDLLKGHNIVPCFILMVRHPMEVARSLEKRDGFDLLKGHLLWMVHNREALQSCRGLEHVIMTFDQLLADPVNTLLKARALEPLQKINPLDYVADILEFIRPDHKHHHQSSPTESKDKLYKHYAWVYDQFRNLQARISISSFESGVGKTDKALPMVEELSEFPLPFSVSSTVKPSAGKAHAAGIFNNLMDIIGRFEQKELSHKIIEKRLLLASENVAETIYAQVYFPDPAHSEQSYPEQNSRKFLLAPGEWQTLSLDIPNPEILRRNRLRLDPLNTRGMVFISGVKLVNAVNDQVCWSAQDRFAGFTAAGDALVLARGDNLVLAATGNDPRLLLPELPSLPDCPMRLEIWIKAGRGQDVMGKYWQALLQNRKQLASKHGELLKQLKNRDSELAGVQEKHEAEIQGLEQIVKDREKSVTELQKQLEHQKDLTTRYFHALAEAEEEQERYREQARLLKINNQHLLAWMHRLDKNFQALLSSARWRVGNRTIRTLELLMLRGKPTLAADRMQQIFSSFRTGQKEFEQGSFKINTHHDARNRKQLETWMRRLNKDFQALKKSMRWRVGNALIRGTEIMIFRFKRPLAVDNLEKNFKAYAEESAEPYGPDLKKMEKRFKTIGNDFKALKKSMRWKVGNGIFSLVDRLLLRGRKTTAMDHALQVIEKIERKGGVTSQE